MTDEPIIWMLLVLMYGILKGAREIAKKKAMSKNTVMEVLVIYTLLSFVFVIPEIPMAGGLEPKYFIFIAIKSFSIFLAWLCSFYSLKKLPVSLYGILDLSRVLFATFFGVVFLHEILNPYQLCGLIIVCAGLLLLKFKPPFLKKLLKVEEGPLDCARGDTGKVGDGGDTRKAGDGGDTRKTGDGPQNDLCKTGDGPQQHSTTFFVILALISCMLNAISGFLDKVLMKDMTSSQLQFWYMLFLIGYYLIYVLVMRIKISPTVFKNGWVWLLAIMFVIGDKALFYANGMPGSKITVMTLIKQSGCIVTIIGGKLIFKEKNTAYRFFCALIIIIGIVLGVMK